MVRAIFIVDADDHTGIKALETNLYFFQKNDRSVRVQVLTGSERAEVMEAIGGNLIWQDAQEDTVSPTLQRLYTEMGGK
jgi:hypothetical protein